jgi:hypothetical protein
VRRSSFTEDEHNFDIGGDYELGLGKGRLKLITLYRFEHSPFVDSFIVDREVGGRTGERFKQTADEGESILRGEYSWRTGGGTDWQVALGGCVQYTRRRFRICGAAGRRQFPPRRLSAASARRSRRSAARPRSPGGVRSRRT